MKLTNLVKEYLLETTVLNEISKNNYQELKDWVSENGLENLSFNNLFGDKQRIVIPFGESKAEGTIGSLMDFFKKNGYEVNLSKGTATKTFINQNGKEQARETRIGKLLQPLADYHKYDKTDQIEKAKQSALQAKKIFPKMDGEDFLVNSERWTEFWNKESEFYIKNPDAVKKSPTEYSIIISRAPIDVLRMSDFDNIHSCHSEGGSYFKCAVAESKGHGPIAYLIHTADLNKSIDVTGKKINLDSEEIFSDSKRNINGIKPIERLRLRKYKNKDKDYELAIPEIRTYGNKIPGFKEAVRDWSFEKQKEYFKGEKPSNLLKEFERYGGSYQDNNDGALFNSFFQTDEYDDYMEVPHIEEDEDNLDRQADEWEHEADEIQDEANNNLKHTSVWHDLSNEGDLWLSYSANTSFEFPIDELNEDVFHIYADDWKMKQKLEKEIKDATKNFFNQMDFNWSSNDRFYITMDIDSSYSGDEPTPDGFRDFCYWVKSDVDDKHSIFTRSVRKILIEHGILNSNEADKILDQFKSDPYTNFGVDIEKNGDYNIGLSEPIEISRNKYDIKIYDWKQELFSNEFKDLFENNILKIERKALAFASQQLNLIGIPSNTPTSSVINKAGMAYMPSIKYIKLSSNYGRTPLTLDFEFEIDADISNYEIVVVANFIDYLDKNFRQIQEIATDTFIEVKLYIEEQIKKNESGIEYLRS